MKVKKAVVLCGGLATRFLPISKSVCKEMLPILNVPVMDIIITELKEAGIEEVLVVVGRNKEILENYFDRNIEVEERLVQTGKTELLAEATRPHKIVSLSFIRQIEAKGTGYATLLARKFAAGEPFLLMYGDELLFGRHSSAQQLIEAYEQQQRSIIAVCKVPRREVSSYGIVAASEFNGRRMKISGIVEKPRINEAPSCFSYIGPAILESNIFDEIEKIEVQTGQEIGITTAYDGLIKQGCMDALWVKGRRFDVGSPLGLVKANVYAALKNKKMKCDLESFLDSLNE